MIDHTSSVPIERTGLAPVVLMRSEAPPADPRHCPTCHRTMPEARTTFAERARAKGLTRREAQVVRLIASGHSNEQIAEELGVSINSVKSYVRLAYRRLGIEVRTHAVLWALGHEVPPTSQAG